MTEEVRWRVTVKTGAHEEFRMLKAKTLELAIWELTNMLRDMEDEGDFKGRTTLQASIQVVP